MGREMRAHTRGLDDRIHAAQVRAAQGDDRTVVHRRPPRPRPGVGGVLTAVAVAALGLLVTAMLVFGAARGCDTGAGSPLAGNGTCAPEAGR